MLLALRAMADRARNVGDKDEQAQLRRFVRSHWPALHRHVQWLLRSQVSFSIGLHLPSHVLKVMCEQVSKSYYPLIQC